MIRQAEMSDAKKPALCYVVVPGAAPGKRIGIVKRGEKGYYLSDYDRPYGFGIGYLSQAKIEDWVREMNERLDVDPAQAESMLMGSMFGWDCPGAQMP